jgi:VWFA-related protein
MRLRTWLRTALPPTLALLAFVAATARPPLAAQAGLNERTLYVSAVDKSGTPVEGLGPDAFIVKENGVRREVLRVSKAVEPIEITVLIDNSTAASDAVNYMRRALPKFIAALSPDNPMSLIGLGDRPTILTPMTTETKALTSRAGSLFALPSSGATFLDGLYEVSQGLLGRETPRAAIVAIITDGTEFTNRYSKDVVAAMKRAQVPAYLVMIGRFEHSNEHAIRERSFLITDAPHDTGGAAFTMLAPTAIEQNLDKVARQLTSQYKLVYGHPQTTIPVEAFEISSSRDGITMRGTPARTAKRGA